MNYSRVLKYLFGLERFGIRLGLENVQNVLRKLGNPQDRFKTIHIAGTNGKGSTAAMLSAILSAEGYKVGLYTSPHLQDVRERVRINDKNISPKVFSEIISKIKKVTERQGIVLTFFEFLTIAAFQYFARQKVDLAVIEVGLGGRLDATNVLNPLVSIITNIGYEHTEHLGSTLSAIAREKAGIIKQSPVITGAKEKETLGVFQEICREKGAPLFVYGKDFKVRKRGGGKVNPLFTFRSKWGEISDLQTSLLGEHQVKNASLAIMAAQYLNSVGIGVKDRSVIHGLKQVYWPGRMETVQADPRIILDGAHNPAGVKTLVLALKEISPSPQKLIIILGVMKDKNIRSMVKSLGSTATRFIIVRPKNDRSAEPVRIRDLLLGNDRRIDIIEDIPKAIIMAKDMAGKDDLICVTGSLFTVGEARAVLVKK